MNDFQQLPTTSDPIRVYWRSDWGRPLAYLGKTEEGEEIFIDRVVSNAKRVSIPREQGPTNPRDPRRWQCPRFTGTAIAFNNDKVLVLGDDNRVHLIDPECLVLEGK